MNPISWTKTYSRNIWKQQDCSGKNTFILIPPQQARKNYTNSPSLPSQDGKNMIKAWVKHSSIQIISNFIPPKNTLEKAHLIIPRVFVPNQKTKKLVEQKQTKAFHVLKTTHKHTFPLQKKQNTHTQKKTGKKKRQPRRLITNLFSPNSSSFQKRHVREEIAWYQKHRATTPRKHLSIPRWFPVRFGLRFWSIFSPLFTVTSHESPRFWRFLVGGYRLQATIFWFVVGWLLSCFSGDIICRYVW